MTRVSMPQSDQIVLDRFEHKQNDFYSQTVAENNARLNNKNIPADVLDELKFIEAALLLSERPDSGE